jgi:hypothetical protein
MIVFIGDNLSTGKLLSQTLDEAVWTIDVVWAFDFVAPLMTPAELALVEWNLFRALVKDIQKNDVGVSNW